LSAVGGQYSDIVYEAGASVYTDTSALDVDALERAFSSISVSLDEFGATLPAEVRDIRRERFLEARYAHQVWTLELPIGNRAVRGSDDVERLVREFHDLHERIFAVRDPGQRVEILQCRGRLIARPFTPPLPDAAGLANGGTSGRKRTAYFSGRGDVEVPVLDGGTLAPESELTGPLLVTEPSTTVVVPPGVGLHTTKLGNYVLELR
jgi:N-methylhydantoinase A